MKHRRKLSHRSQTRRKMPCRATSAAQVLQQASLAALPRFVKPALATLVATPPDDKRWEHETKFDGYRIQARLDYGKIKLLTRKGLDWTKKFPSIVKAVHSLHAKTALIDGELVANDTHGISRFSLLQQDLSDCRQGRLVLYAFDLLHLNGADLKRLPLYTRKAALAKLLRRSYTGAHLRFSRPLHGHGPALLKRACQLGQEGIVSKLRDAPYHSGRGRDWLKAKCSARQELVVAGFTPSSVNSNTVGALVLAFFGRGKLHYAGRTGTGFTRETARALYRTLIARERKTSPFKPVPKEERRRRGTIWVEPNLVVEVDFHGWTQGNRVRQASFQGVRRDKAAKEVAREVIH